MSIKTLNELGEFQQIKCTSSIYEQGRRKILNPGWLISQLQQEEFSMDKIKSYGGPLE